MLLCGRLCQEKNLDTRKRTLYYQEKKVSFSLIDNKETTKTYPFGKREVVMRHLIDPMDLSVEEIQHLLELADDIILHKEKYQEVCKHKKLATLFFEPSTRTRLSFEAAMMELGGNVLGFSSADSSSATKGESVSDTVRVVSGYADIIAMRHPKEGAPYVAAQKVNIPIINAGDGGHNHPTQTLTDLMTIRREKGRLNDLTIGMCGDLKFGRTVHSQIGRAHV